MMPAADVTPGSTSNESPDLGLLFHRLNNQLGIILANAELLEHECLSYLLEDAWDKPDGIPFN